MKKLLSVFIFIILLFINTYSQNLYQTLLDSIEIAFSNNSIKKINIFSDMLIKADSNRYEGYFYKSYVLYKKQDYVNAYNFCEKSYTLKKDSENTYLFLLLNSKLNKSYNDILFLALDSFPNDKRFLKFTANQFKESSQYDSMFIYSKRALSIDPDDEQSLLNCAYYLVLNKKYKKATQYYKALYDNYNKPYYGFMLAELYNKLGYYEHSNRILNTINSKDYNYKIHRLKADNYFLKYDYINALQEYKYLLYNYPDSIDTYINLTAVLSKTKDSILLDSIIIKIKNTSLSNKHINTIADNLFKLNLYTKALELYKIIYSNDSLFYSEYALKSGVFTENFEFAKKILDNFPDSENKDVNMFYYSGLVYYKNRLFEDSKQSFENALKLSPGDTIIIMNLANTYYILKEDAKLLSLIDSIAINNKIFSDYLLKEFFPEQKE